MAMWEKICLLVTASATPTSASATPISSSATTNSLPLITSASPSISSTSIFPTLASLASPQLRSPQPPLFPLTKIEGSSSFLQRRPEFDSNHGNPSTSEATEDDKLPKTVCTEDALHKQVRSCTGRPYPNRHCSCGRKLPGEAIETNHGEL